MSSRAFGSAFSVITAQERVAAAVALVLAGVSSAPARAQNEPSSDADTALQQVVVTAQFREERVQDTPIAITALSGEMLAARNQTNITEVTANAPNVTLTPAGAGFGSSATASIRGVGQADFNFALEPGVGMYIDDVYYGVLFGSIFDLTDLDRVEVLRGPQGTLSGKNSIGGAIKLFSRKPNENPDAYVEGTYGRFERMELRAGGNFTLVPDKLFVRLSGVSKRRDGFLKELDYDCATGGANRSGQISRGCVIGTEGGQDLYALRAALRWVASDKVEDNLIADKTEDSSEVQASKLIAQGPPGTWSGAASYLTTPDSYTNYATFIGHPGTANEFTIPRVSTMSGWGVSNTLDIAISDTLSLKSISAFRHSAGQFSQDIDLSPIDVETIYNVVSHRQVSQELRLSGTAGGDLLDWTVGAFYYEARQTIGGRKDIPTGVVPGGGIAPGTALLDFMDDDVIESDSKSAFVHVIAHPMQDLSLIGGLRYTDESKDYTFTRDVNGLPFSLGYPGMPFDLTPLTGLTGSYSGSRIDYRAGVEYRWSRQVMTYAQYSTGFKGGGVNPRPFVPSQLLPFGQEKLNAVELGAKSDLLGGTLRLNGAVFYNKYKDIQLTALACPTAPCALPINAGDANVKGAELELEFHPIDALSLDAAASYLQFDYTRVSAQAGVPGVSGVQKNMGPPFTPQRKFSVGAQYEVALGAGGSITPRLDWAYQSEIFTNAVNAPTNRLESRGLLNGRITWRTQDGAWQTTLSGTNLTNKFYYVNSFDLAGPPFFVLAGQPGRPREWAVTLKRTF
jgi:iron complex outermembrane receptor protein